VRGVYLTVTRGVVGRRTPSMPTGASKLKEVVMNPVTLLKGVRFFFYDSVCTFVPVRTMVTLRILGGSRQ